MNIVSERVDKPKRTILGHYCTLDDASFVYLLRRKHRDLWRRDHQTISGAMAEDHACWCINEEQLTRLRREKIALLGVRVQDTGDVWIAPLADWLDLRKARIREDPPMQRGFQGAPMPRMRALPLRFFDRPVRGEVALNIARLSTS